ncbi:MAG: sensor histidine kinase [Arcobacter sp.]|uniref:sensor histidine kinase n=1 Tax=uncultured Arcobacter sp. TaxID=165434 RepID=UPI000CB50056|nr:sensor histidine kinase [uncultured Arcobacter sp.]PLY11125.1 MAG: sensor histidine kinase [Arcobacter sp.]
MIEIKELSKKNKNFGLKLFISYIVFTIILITSIITIHMFFSDGLAANKFEREIKLQSNEKKDIFYNFFHSREDEIQAIAKNEYFLEYIKKGKYKYYIDLLLITIMEANKEYMQIRYIDENGLEVLRFDRDKHSKIPYKSLILQNKSNRYYFKEVSKLKKGDTWFSKIDLNIEHQKIEIPFKSVVRIATPMIINNKFKGILIINIFMEELLDAITKSSLYDIYLIDEDGYYFRHKNSKYNWSNYDTKRTIKEDFELDLIQSINTTKGNFIFHDNIFIQPLISDNQIIKMIMLEKEESIQEVKESNNKMIFTILFFAIIMSLFFTIIFTNALKNIFELVVLQANRLHELATSLDTKVMMNTLEIAKKDRLLQNQSKLAELGDMIGNIAHQWRHPLTRLSLTLQNLKAFKSKNKMSDKMFQDGMENSLYQIEFMSNTIDNFKDFYKKDVEKSKFRVKDAIENVLKIIGAVLEHSNIKLYINCEKEVIINGNKNEFSQVMMNLIINAKDAIDDKKVLDGEININICNKEEQIKIEVSDNAGGVASCLKEEIFNPYFTTKETKGTGIGLYISKAIIEDKMNGKLTLENGQNGAIFTILLKKDGK